MNRTPLVMDFDTGTDDAIALVTALLYRDVFEVCAVTTVAGNVPLEYTSANTLNIIDLLGHTDIKVAKGADKPLTRTLECAISHGKTGLGDVVMSESSRAFYEKDAAETMYEAAVEHKGELVVLATGPQTNIALAIQRHPDIVSMIKKVYIMGGCLVGGNMTQASEFNAYVDPEALKILFHSGLDVTMIGLDVTLKTELPIWVKDKLSELSSKEAQLTVRILNFMLQLNKESGWDIANLHDVVAFCAIVNPEVLTMKKYYVDVETEGTITRGMTVADFRDVYPDRKKNITCAIDVDFEGFWNWFVNVYNKYEKKK